MKTGSTILLIMGILLISSISYLLYTSSSNIPFSSNNQTCIKDEFLKTHYHYTLNIYSNGTEIPIPQNIGVSNGCIREMHTHEETNLIHIESEKEGFKSSVQDFLDVWREDSRYKIEGQKMIGNLTMVINGIKNRGTYYNPDDGDIVVMNYKGVE